MTATMRNHFAGTPFLPADQVCDGQRLVSKGQGLATACRVRLCKPCQSPLVLLHRLRR